MAESSLVIAKNVRFEDNGDYNLVIIIFYSGVPPVYVVDGYICINPGKLHFL